MSKEQAVAETDGVAKPTSEAGSAQDDYEALLSEYTKDVKPPVTEPAPVKGDDLQDLLQWAREQRESKARETFNTELSDAVKAVKELSETSIPDRLVKGYLNTMADEDPRIKAAWENRHSNPAGWKAALKKVAAELKNDTPNVDSSVTEDREAMTAAVRGVRTKDQAAPDVNKMSSQEFNKHLQELGIAR